MTRPKVPADKRQRTAQACDSCKRRKQKCNGLKPCNTCVKRGLGCIYSTADGLDDSPGEEAGASPSKRRHVDTPLPSQPPAASENTPPSAPLSSQPVRHGADAHPRRQYGHEVAPQWQRKPAEQPGISPLVKDTMAAKHSTLPSPSLVQEHQRRRSDNDFEDRSRTSTMSGPDEEATFMPSVRMLQDPTGRLLYLGDSATLSYLQLVRMMVESTVGPSPFTEDPQRHRIMENITSQPSTKRPPHLLVPPDRQTATVLVDSFFTNTMGLIDVFNRKEFTKAFEICYSSPLDVDPSSLCLIYLVFAIGLVLATPSPGTREDAIIRRLRNDPCDWADLFYRSSKSLGVGESGLEDADFWSVQALVLISVYMLAVSKRNAAYAYYGMAVRSAFALGLHREEAIVPEIFGRDMVNTRRNLWRTLFVLDRFLSASLGRPTAISEEDCSGDRLTSSKQPKESQDTSLEGAHTGGLDAAVRSSLVIGVILRKVYSRRKISTALAQEIANKGKDWPHRLHPSLHWRQAATGATVPGHGIAILHINLLQCHSTILLTRPFFLYIFTNLRKGKHGARPIGTKMERFSESCVVASYHTVYLVNKAYLDNYLPQRNPFILHFLFAASLIVLTNEFGGLYHNDDYANCIGNAITVMQYCAETDPQAKRLLFILVSFNNVVVKRKQTSGVLLPARPTISTVPATNYDPMLQFLGYHHPQTAAKGASLHRQESELSTCAAATRPSSTSSTAQSRMPATGFGNGAPGPRSALPHSATSETGMQLNGATPPTSATASVFSPPVDFGRSVAASEAPDSLGGPGGGDEFDFDMLWHWQGNPTYPPPVQTSAAATAAQGMVSTAPDLGPPVGSTVSMGPGYQAAYSGLANGLPQSHGTGAGGSNGSVHLYPNSNYM